MGDELRKSGIDILGDVPWGTHFCQFYGTKEDLADILVPYFKAGLENNEFCMWVTAHPLSREDAEEALSKAFPGFAACKERGQIEIIPHDEWYLKGGSFDSRRVLDGWVDKLDKALEKGFDGLRLTGNTFWLEEKDWRDFVAYEEAVDGVIGGYRMMALCTYSLDKCSAAEVMDVVANHRYALTKRDGKWDLIESSERRRADEALRKERDFTSAVLDTAGALVVVLDREGRIRRFNRACEAITGYTDEEVLGRVFWDFLIPPEDMQGVRQTWDALKAGSFPNRHENHWVAKDGSLRFIEWSNTALTGEDGAVTFVIATGLDITERKRAEEALRLSERRVRQKLESILSPGGDIGSLELSDIINAPAVQSLMDNFYEVSGVPVGILDLKGRVLVGVGWQDICTKFHRAHPETCKHCTESDTQLSAGVLQGEFRLYKCKNNMWDIATPIMVGTRHVGNIFMGQFFFDDETPDYEFFGSQARKYEFDEKEYIAALDAVPRFSRKFVEAGMAFHARLANMLSQQSYSNIKLARALAEREALTVSLLEGENRLKRSQEIAHLGSWELDIPSNKLTWSDEVYRIFGLKPQEFAATYEAFLNAVHPDDRAAVDAAYSSSLRDGRDTYEIEHRVVKPGGEVRFVHEKCEHFRDASGRIIRSIGMVHDITERKKAEEAILRVKEEWERTFDAVPDLVAIMDDQHRIVRANRAMADRLGLTPQECAGQVCYCSVHGTDRPPDTCPHVLTLADGKEHEMEVHEERLGGDFLVTTTPLSDEHGRRVGSVHIARDITARKAMERQKADFLAMLTHDLKSPLTSIIGFTDLILLKKQVDADIAAMLINIQHGGLKLVRMVEDFLTMARMEAGEFQLRIRPEDLGDLLKRVGEEFRPQAEKKGLAFRCESCEGLPKAPIDRKQMERVIDNLLQNAFNYTPEGGTVTLRAGASGGGITVSVEDTGAGIPAEEQARIFDKYYRSPRTSGIKGTGLGLAIVKAVTEAHGGRVELASQPGIGSKFVVHLPAGENTPPPPPSAAPSPAGGEG